MVLWKNGNMFTFYYDRDCDECKAVYKAVCNSLESSKCKGCECLAGNDDHYKIFHEVQFVMKYMSIFNTNLKAVYVCIIIPYYTNIIMCVKLKVHGMLGKTVLAVDFIKHNMIPAV